MRTFAVVNDVHSGFTMTVLYVRLARQGVDGIAITPLEVLRCALVNTVTHVTSTS